MEPAVPPPKGLVGRSIDFKLKPGWRVDRGGAQFAPPPLPEKSRIVYKVPTLAKSAARKLSRAEQDLQRYMHVLLPPAESPLRHVASIQTWPCVEEAHVAPEISLPAEQAPKRRH